MQECKSHKEAQMLIVTANKDRRKRRKGTEEAKTGEAKQKLQKHHHTETEMIRDDRGRTNTLCF